MEKEFMHWLMTVLLPIGIGVLGALTTTRQNANRLEHRLTTLEVINREQEKTIDNQNSRLNKHDAELYAKHRATMRVDEDALRELRYKIEDDILAELTAEG